MIEGTAVSSVARRVAALEVALEQSSDADVDAAMEWLLQQAQDAEIKHPGGGLEVLQAAMSVLDRGMRPRTARRLSYWRRQCRRGDSGG